jgi:hypothetical protein
MAVLTVQVTKPSIAQTNDGISATLKAEKSDDPFKSLAFMPWVSKHRSLAVTLWVSKAHSLA